MTEQTTTKPSPATVNNGGPKLKLRAPTQAEIMEMAESGTDIKQAPETLADMKSGADIASGGEA